MEIEVKFTLPDADTLRRLQADDHLAAFTLSAGSAKQVHDTYMDTTDRAILAAGFALRQREQEGGTLISVKGLGGAQGAVHRREELEILLPADQPPAKWPAGPVRDWVLQTIGEAPLNPLLELRQTRVVRQVTRGEQAVAELSLDEVHAAVADTEQSYLELEVELAPQGTEDDLATLAAYLQEELGLEPEPRSKFERALALLQSARSEGHWLTQRENAIWRQIAKREDMYGRRARALLALDAGHTQAEASKHAGLSERRVRYWLAAFRKQGLGIFPVHVLAESTPAPPLSRPEPPTQLQPRPKVARRSKSQAKPKALKPPDKPGLEASDSMAEAARKTLYFHFQRMLYHEPGTRTGEDIEELHDMRVATRRMRAALRVFGNYLNTKQMAPFAKGLKRTGRTLGAMRDLDVFWEKTQRYLDTLPVGRQGDLDPLRAVWQAEREKARESMLAYLDSECYVQFKEQFGEFLQTPGAGALPEISEKGEPLPHRLRHVLPVIVHQRMAAVRSYDEWVTGEGVPLERLHQLRIAAKGLRYTLEFFEEVLGAEAKALIKEIKGLQDHLGDLQDAVVASTLLRDFLTWGTWGHAAIKGRDVSFPTEPIVAPGVAAYLTVRQTELQHLLDMFPQAWARVQDVDFSQLVAAALAVL
jgi:CHAD domain-containing protein